MKTSNLQQGRAHHEAIIRGWVGNNRAGPGGITVGDGTTSSPGIWNLTVIGGTLIVDPDGSAVLIIDPSTPITPNIITASGTAAIDLTLGPVWDITLTANSTITISNPTDAQIQQILVILRQGGSGSYTVTWPSSVDWQDPTTGLGGGSAPTLFTAVGAQNDISLTTIDTGTTWGGSMVGAGGGGATTLDGLTDVTIASPANANRLRYDGSLWQNSNLVWEPMIASDGSVMTDGLLNPMMSEVPY